MRRAGRISDWKEDKGYGFVVPHDGGDRAFVHIKAFQSRSRRPTDGDLVSYATSRDSRGRTNAVDVRFAGQKIEAPSTSRAPQGNRQRKPARGMAVVGIVFLLGSVVGTMLGILPAVTTISGVLMSVLSYWMYAEDKFAAGKGGQRIRESTLHVLDLLGGWPGAFVAQQQFRHKTVKASFRWTFWFTVAVNLAIVAWLLQSGLAHALDRSLFGG